MTAADAQDAAGAQGGSDLRGADIVFDRVSYAYGDSAPALDGLDLRIQGSSFVAVLGANGSGKSTLAQHINGLLKPTSGTVSIGSFSTGDPSQAMEIRRHVGMVFQNPDNQAVASIVADDVAFGPENLGLPPAEITRRVDEALAAVALGAYAHKEIHALSGGQKQRVAIAATLAMHPDILVLDEPGAMLDVRGRRGIVRVAHEMCDAGLTVVMVTHFMEDALSADSVVVLDKGKVALSGSPEEVFSDAERLRSLSLELPFSVMLAEELGKRGIRVGAGLDEARLQEELVELMESRQGAVGGGGRGGGGCEAGDPDGDPDGGEPLVTLEGVGFSYDDGGARGKASKSKGQRSRRSRRKRAASTDAEMPRLVVTSIDLELSGGDFLGLVGHTGSGKTTVSRLMNALLVPSLGSVVVDGMDTRQARCRREVRSRVGLVFQYPETQLFASSVAEDVGFGPKNLGLGPDEIERRVRSALARVGLSFAEVADRSPFELSGGQQRRVALAGVLAMEPKVLVLDEPAAGMDPQGTAGIEQLLVECNHSGVAIVLISHSMDEIAELCSKVVVFDQGHILLQGAPEQVFSAEYASMLHDVNLGLPRAAKFAMELAEKGFSFERQPLTMGELIDGLDAAVQGGGVHHA